MALRSERGHSCLRTGAQLPDPDLPHPAGSGGGALSQQPLRGHSLLGSMYSHSSAAGLKTNLSILAKFRILNKLSAIIPRQLAGVGHVFSRLQSLIC